MATKQDEEGRRQPDAPISRRTFIEGVVAASAATGAVAATARSAAGSAPAPTTDAGDGARLAGVAGDAAPFEVLTPEQGRLLTAVLDRIIPADGVMPAAGDAGVAGYVDRVLQDAPHLRRPVVDLLDELRGCGFACLPGPERDERLRRLAADRPEPFDVLLHAAYAGYYSNPRVLTAAGWLPAGSAPPEPFDPTLLDAVRRRGPIYRNV